MWSVLGAAGFLPLFSLVFLVLHCFEPGSAQILGEVACFLSTPRGTSFAFSTCIYRERKSRKSGKNKDEGNGVLWRRSWSASKDDFLTPFVGPAQTGCDRVLFHGVFRVEASTNNLRLVETPEAELNVPSEIAQEREKKMEDQIGVGKILALDPRANPCLLRGSRAKRKGTKSTICSFAHVVRRDHHIKGGRLLGAEPPPLSQGHHVAQHGEAAGARFEPVRPLPRGLLRRGYDESRTAR